FRGTRAAKRPEELGDGALYCRAETVARGSGGRRRKPSPCLVSRRRQGRKRPRAGAEFGLDQSLRIERGEAAGEIFKLAHVSGPWIAAEALHRGWLDRLGWKPLRGAAL